MIRRTCRYRRAIAVTRAQRLERHNRNVANLRGGKDSPANDANERESKKASESDIRDNSRGLAGQPSSKGGAK